jgi:hypothetical protein
MFLIYAKIAAANGKVCGGGTAIYLVNNNYAPMSIIISGVAQDHQGGQPLIVVHGIAADLASVSGGTALTGGKGIIDAESCVFLCAFASHCVILDAVLFSESQHNKPS